MRYSVDAICKHEATGKYVIIERLSFPFGLALPGGGIEEGENKTSAIIREVEEETGLKFKIKSWLPKEYNDPNRDPRWPATSYVAEGVASGDMHDEAGKTKVILLSKDEIVASAKKFAFDHYQIFCDYLLLMTK